MQFNSNSTKLIIKKDNPMKKLILAILAFALITPMTFAQGGDGDGPHRQMRGDFSNVELPEDLQGVWTELEQARTALHASRQLVLSNLGDDASDETIKTALQQWAAANADEIDVVRGLAQQIRDYIRENRPEREDVEVTDEMLRRRMRFRENTREMRQLKNQYANGEIQKAQFREQMGDLLRERKQLMRRKRGDEAGGGGDDGPRRGGE
jgi:hypothetical protein